MPRYKVKELSFIGGSLVQPGEEIEYDGNPGSALERLDNAYRARRKAEQPEQAEQAEQPEQAEQAEQPEQAESKAP